MKAIDILKDFIKEGINCEFVGIIDVPNEGEFSWEQNEEWWLDMVGGVPPYPIESGEYLYYYSNDMDYKYDVEIELSDGSYIYLIRLTDN